MNVDAYPVSISVQPPVGERNRLTTAFRIILAIPHLILIGGIGLGAFGSSDDRLKVGGETGLLGAVAYFLAIVSWVTIVFAGRHVVGIRQFTAFYLRWRVRAIAYLMLLEDLYPPFGDAEYPASLTLVDPPADRDRVSVAFRIILVIPHLIVLFFLVLGWWITAVVAWFVILITGRYPEGLYTFGVSVLQWLLRVEAYLLLMVDAYPPFSFV